MIYFIYSLILLTTFLFLGTTSESQLVQTLVNYYPKEASFFVIGSLIIAFTFIAKESGKRLRNKWLFAFLTFSIFQFFLYLYMPLVGVYKEGKFFINFWTVRPYINIFTGILLIKVLAEHLTNKDWVKVFKFLCWCGFIISIYSILQFLGIDGIGSHFEKNFINGNPERKQLMTTFLTHHTLTAAYVAMTAPLCLLFKDLRYKVFLGVMACSLILMDSLVGIVGFLVSMFLYLLLTKKFRILMLFIILSTAGLLVLNNQYQNFLSDNGRFGLWKEVTVDVLKNKPFHGFGHGSFSEKYNSPSAKLLFAHNDYIQELNEGGLPGFIILGFWLWNMLCRGLINVTKQWFILDIVILCSFVCTCVIAFGSFPFHYAPLAVIGILYIAYIESQNINYRGLV